VARDPQAMLYDLLRRDGRVACVGEVLRYEPNPSRVDVLIGVREDRVTPDGEPDPQPPVTVPGVPVVWPRGGGRSLTWGLEPGDRVLLVYRHRSHDEVDGGARLPVLPAAGRRQNESDVIALPGFLPPGGASAGEERPAGEVVLAMPSGEALHLGAPNAALRIVVAELLSPYLAALEGWLATHTHSGVTTGPGVSGPPVLPPPDALSPGEMATDRLRVDS
jgi:hypothetical protein